MVTATMYFSGVKIWEADSVGSAFEMAVKDGYEVPENREHFFACSEVFDNAQTAYAAWGF